MNDVCKNKLDFKPDLICNATYNVNFGNTSHNQYNYSSLSTCIPKLI